jgi:hypothetical protein
MAVNPEDFGGVPIRAARVRPEDFGGVAVAETKPFPDTNNIIPSGSPLVPRAPSRLKPILDPAGDVVTGMTGTLRGALNLTSPGRGDEMLPKGGGGNSALQFAGAMADPVALATGIGVAKVLPTIPFLGRIFAQGGYAPVLNKAAQGAAPAVAGGGIRAVGQNLASGAATGGVVGALSDDMTFESGAGIGAAANVILPPALSVLGRGAGALFDVATGNMSKIKAGNVIRQAAGDDLPAYRAALAAAAPDETAAQAGAGLKRDTLDALGQFAATADDTSYYSRNAARQMQAITDPIRALAGGNTQTAAKQGVVDARKGLNQATAPMRETELGAANIAGTTGRRLQAEADELGAIAAAKVDDVRRLSTAGAKAQELADSGAMRIGRQEPPTPGLPRVAGRYSQGAGLADIAERGAASAADSSLALGDAARFAQARADSVAAAGLKPLDTNSIISNIDRMLKDPTIGPSDINRKVLSAVSKKIQTWTDNGGGVIDAQALYEIRKNTVNEVVQKLMTGADPKAQQKVAAGLLGKVKPMIDNAIESAGGTGWRDYLKAYENGMRLIDQRKLGAKALEFLEKSPKQFLAFVGGNDPKTVEKILKNTDFDIRRAMGDKMAPLDEAARQVARDISIEEGASRGGVALRGILEENVPSFKLFNVLDPRVAVANRVLGEAELMIGSQMKRYLTEGMKTGKSAMELIDALPAAEKAKVMKAIVDQLRLPAIGGAISSAGNEQQ